MFYVEAQTLPTEIFKITDQSTQDETLEDPKTTAEHRIRVTTQTKRVNPLAPTPGFKSKVVWFNAIGFLLLHIAAAYSGYLGLFEAELLTVIWSKLRVFQLSGHEPFFIDKLCPSFVAASSLGYLCGIAITLGGHRMYAHRAFKANVWIRLVVVVLHTIAGQV